MFQQLLVPLDGSSEAERALTTAVIIAKLAGAKLDMVSVRAHHALDAVTSAERRDAAASSEERYLASKAEDVRTQNTFDVTESLLSGDVSDAICERASSIHADLVVMTSHRRTGLDRARLGSIADELIHKSVMPLLILRNHAAHETATASESYFRNILVLHDGSDRSLSIVGPAAELARCMNARLTLLRVVEPILVAPQSLGDKAMASLALGISAIAVASALPPLASTAAQDVQATDALVATTRQQLLDIVDSLRHSAIAAIDVAVVVASDIAPAIIEYAAQNSVDLIALASHGHGASRWLLGSIADEISNYGTMPILMTQSAPAHVLANSAEIPSGTIASGATAFVNDTNAAS